MSFVSVDALNVARVVGELNTLGISVGELSPFDHKAYIVAFAHFEKYVVPACRAQSPASSNHHARACETRKKEVVEVIFQEVKEQFKEQALDRHFIFLLAPEQTLGDSLVRQEEVALYSKNMARLRQVTESMFKDEMERFGALCDPSKRGQDLSSLPALLSGLKMAEPRFKQPTAEDFKRMDEMRRQDSPSGTFAPTDAISKVKL